MKLRFILLLVALVVVPLCSVAATLATARGVDESYSSPSQNRPGRVKPGIDVLIEKNINLLKGKRVGLITNQTGANRRLEHTIDLLYKHPKVNLVVNTIRSCQTIGIY